MLKSHRYQVWVSLKVPSEKLLFGMWFWEQDNITEGLKTPRAWSSPPLPPYLFVLLLSSQGPCPGFLH